MRRQLPADPDDGRLAHLSSGKFNANAALPAKAHSPCPAWCPGYQSVDCLLLSHCYLEARDDIVAEHR